MVVVPVPASPVDGSPDVCTVDDDAAVCRMGGEAVLSAVSAAVDIPADIA